MLISCLNGQTDRAKSYEPCRILDFARVVVVLGELHRLEYTRHGILPYSNSLTIPHVLFDCPNAHHRSFVL